MGRTPCQDLLILSHKTPVVRLVVQRIRDALKQHTGVDPPKAPPLPKMEAYGSADLAESGSLMSQLRHLYSGEGIFSKLPQIMEEYGLQYVPIHQHCLASLSSITGLSTASSVPHFPAATLSSIGSMTQVAQIESRRQNTRPFADSARRLPKQF